MKTIVFLLLFCCFIPASSPSQNYQVTVTTVSVWVKTLDKSGQPVSGLTPSDFEVYEDKKKVDLTCFEEVNTVNGLQEASPSAPAGIKQMQAEPPRKKFVLFLDLLNTSQAEYLGVRPKIEEFVDQVTKTDSDTMIAGITPEGKLGVLLQFTNNAQRMRQVIGTVQANPVRDQRLIKNERELNDMLEIGGMADDPNISNAFRLAKTYALQEEKISRFSLKAMETFANYLQTFNRNEHLVIVFISGGFNADPGRHYLEVLRRLTGIEAEAVSSMGLQEAVRETNFNLLREVQNSIGKLNRTDTTVYAINTRGMSIYDANQSRDDQYLMDYQDSLAQIAKETGGIAFQNGQDFKTGFDRIFDDLNHQYLLCYNAPEHKKADEYHRIRVVVKKPNLSVRHRQGYVG